MVDLGDSRANGQRETEDLKIQLKRLGNPSNSGRWAMAGEPDGGLCLRRGSALGFFSLALNAEESNRK
jgi:hypothetical protein